MFSGAAVLTAPSAPVLFIEFNQTTLKSMGADTKDVKVQLETFRYHLFRFEASSLRFISYAEIAAKRSFKLIALKDYDGMQNIS